MIKVIILNTTILQKKPPCDQFAQRHCIIRANDPYDGRVLVGKGHAAAGASTVFNADAAGAA
jgi:hypothetical protein